MNKFILKLNNFLHLPFHKKIRNLVNKYGIWLSFNKEFFMLYEAYGNKFTDKITYERYTLTFDPLNTRFDLKTAIIHEIGHYEDMSAYPIHQFHLDAENARKCDIKYDQFLIESELRAWVNAYKIADRLSIKLNENTIAYSLNTYKIPLERLTERLKPNV